jgi:hypothetical protein
MPRFIAKAMVSGEGIESTMTALMIDPVRSGRTTRGNNLQPHPLRRSESRVLQSYDRGPDCVLFARNPWPVVRQNSGRL